jgi:hypothetical protein
VDAAHFADTPPQFSRRLWKILRVASKIHIVLTATASKKWERTFSGRMHKEGDRIFESIGWGFFDKHFDPLFD